MKYVVAWGDRAHRILHSFRKGNLR